MAEICDLTQYTGTNPGFISMRRKIRKSGFDLLQGETIYDYAPIDLLDENRGYYVIKAGDPTYQITRNTDGMLVCDCQSFAKWGMCKHQIAITEDVANKSNLLQTMETFDQVAGEPPYVGEIDDEEADLDRYAGYEWFPRSGGLWAS